MQLQSELRHPLPKIVQEAISFSLVLKAQDDVVRVADGNHLALPVPHKGCTKCAKGSNFLHRNVASAGGPLCLMNGMGMRNWHQERAVLR